MYIGCSTVGRKPKGTSTTVSSLARGNRFWRVRAVDAAGNAGAWSASRSLTVK